MNSRVNEWVKSTSTTEKDEEFSSTSADTEETSGSQTRSRTTVGTPTITSSLQAAGMPQVIYDDVFRHVSSSASSYATTSEDGRKRAGRNNSDDSPDSVIVSINDEKKKTSREECCCIHGKPCAIGRSSIKNEKSKKGKREEAAEYEQVKFDKLENPPESFASRRSSDRSDPGRSRKPSCKKQVVYRCHYPSDLSSINAPSTCNDGVYENINILNNLSKTSSSSSFPMASACDSSVSGCPSSETPRRCRPSGTHLEDFYLGGIRKREAEKRINKNTHFGLYHRVPSTATSDIGTLKDHILLYIVYKTSKGDYLHYPIQRERFQNTKRYFIECEGQEPCRFNSLDALVRYYSVYVDFRLGDDDADVELFPLPTKVKKTPRRHKSTATDEEAGHEKSKRARDPAAAQQLTSQKPLVPQSTVQLKSCLKKSTGDESGQGTGNGSSSSKGNPRVKFLLVGEESSSRGELVMVGNKNNNLSDAGAPVATDFISKNIQKVTTTTTTTSSQPPLLPTPPQFIKSPQQNLRNSELAMASRNNPNFINTPTTSATVDISQQMISLLTRCSDVVTNLTGVLGYVPYHPL